MTPELLLHGREPRSNREGIGSEPSRGGYTATAGQRVLLRVLILTILAVVGGALLAPWVARGLVSMGRWVDAWGELRDISFVRVASRCVLGALLVGGGLWGGVWGAFGSLRQMGLERIDGWARGWAAGFGLGVATMGLVLGLGLGTGAFGWGEKPPAAAAVGVILALGPAIVVGLVEETLFCGVLFGALRACSRWWLAVAGASALFALVHFASPVPATGIAHPHWYSGLALIPDMFRKVHADAYYLPFGWSLAMMGVVLCLIYDRYRTLYPVWGLHAGWVWVLYGWGECLERQHGISEFWFGADDQAAKGYLVLILLSAMAAGLVAARLTPTAQSSPGDDSGRAGRAGGPDDKDPPQIGPSAT